MNKEMISKMNRLKFETEKAYQFADKAKNFKEPPPKPKVERDSLFAEFDSGPMGGTAGMGSTAASKMSGVKICKCGSRSPRFKGYCEECVTKLKKRYELLSERN